MQIGFLVFPNLTQLDLTGPYETLARLPASKVHLVAGTVDPIRSDTGLVIQPTVPYADCPSLDLICVPGGPGVNEAMLDEETLAFLRERASSARYVTSVCSGALVLGAAGLLRGYRATTHWASMQFLSRFGAIPVRERICVDRDRVTGGGVTAGIDFGLYIAAELRGQAVAERIQLYLEYAPAPPFHAGTPDTAPEEVRTAYAEAAAAMMERRAASVERAVAALALDAN
ncbi:MAG TPA: DJ-1/PfpI family protein [Candidatus Dormibacteraeota bacterium]|jgi:cyclohexyl-isocyanide hydratase